MSKPTLKEAVRFFRREDLALYPNTSRLVEALDGVVKLYLWAEDVIDRYSDDGTDQYESGWRDCARSVCDYLKSIEINTLVEPEKRPKLPKIGQEW